ncbi:Alpha/beta hydrolase fold-1 [Mycena latifolia]|nr:Alpha/beta hydrolase fold-1 [Mycena latifolia]
MKRSLFTSPPHGACPFNVEAVRYVPDDSFADGFTLVFLHAMNLHKETFEPMILHLLRQTWGVRIRDIWCIDNPNHGRSARLNQKLLSTPKYRGHWTVAEYSRAVHSFLTSKHHGIDFTTRKLIGLAHSGAGPSLMLLQDEMPRIMFHGFIFMDPALFPRGNASVRILCELFGNLAKSKRHTWDSRAAAMMQLSTTALKRWDHLAVELFVENALHPTADGSSVTLACSPAQEAAFYLSPDRDLVGRPFEIFAQLTASDKLPMHMLVSANDEYKGKAAEIKQMQMKLVKATTRGSVQIIEGGHMFPQVEPVLCARAILRVLGKLQLDKSQSGVAARL